MNPNKQTYEKPKDKDEKHEQTFNLNDIPEVKLTGHQWMQMGNELRCTSCSFTHGTFIDPEYQLYAVTEDGQPMIRKIIVKH